MVIEDDEAIGSTVESALVANGYIVDRHLNGGSATEALPAGVATVGAAGSSSPAGSASLPAASSLPDLVLLDAGLPDMDGFSLCRWLRRNYPDLPIVMVTARDAEIDIVVGLDAGATDYVTKPFSINVLLARVRAHLRTTDVVDPDLPLTVGPLSVFATAYRATLDGALLELRPREFQLLTYFAQNAGRVVTREQILSSVWDLHWDSSTKTVDMHVLALRRALGDRVEIVNIRGVGYRMESP